MATATFTSYRAVVVFNSQTIGTIQQADWSIDYGVKPIFEIDRVVAREISPTTYSVNFNFSGVKVMADDFDESGLVAMPGSNYMLPYISLCLFDRLTNIPLLNIRAASIQSLKYSISTKNFMTFDISGIGILTEGSGTDPDASNPPVPQSFT